MKFKFFILIFIFYSHAYSSDMHINIRVQQSEKAAFGLAFVGTPTDENKTMMERLKKDLEYSGQCIITLKYIEKTNKKSEFEKVFPEDISLGLFISNNDTNYLWRLYDLISIEMITGKKVEMLGKNINVLAHIIADQVWPKLMGCNSSFQSKIAYSKQIWKTRNGKEKPYKEIWISDFDGSRERPFINTPTVNIAPRWNRISDCPLLFYSENTISNVQLVMSNMFNKRQVICCFDGLNMQPTFSPNGKEVVFCLSKDGSSQLYHSYVNGLSKQKNCVRLTFNDGNNISPCFIDANKIIFVSDFETNKPQLYILDISKSEDTPIRITDDGYCACPSYCPVNNKLVYSKIIDHNMQLFEYDCASKKHTQLTSGKGSKEEPTWSACGNYIVFGMNEGLKSRISQLNLITKKIHYLTSQSDHCTYPSCSPIYEQCLGILKE